ncbi:TlyA family RNA methyltransferase [Marinomonas algicola]|uniref:TlyA family RNA methyltransferase n=1 Tax=Marinomonas algicola TaxID=2773454 RepID=UPI001748BCA6|nr:TlyA family RNA methyltransferase [Marinomonas algicola]
MKRIDIVLTEKNIAKSRSQAQSFIQEKRVFAQIKGQLTLITKPSTKVTPECEIQLQHSDTDQYVSRGALKLVGALELSQLDIAGFTVLDVGQSTGGFTDCALQQGAGKVIGIEVGHDQLDSSLIQDPRVVCLEGVNARNLNVDDLGEHFPEKGFDLAVMDVSFISQAKILPQLPELLSEEGHLISLVKPQFEVGKEGIGKGGIVKDPSLFKQVEQRICKLVSDLGFSIQSYTESPIKGGDGNREFLLWAKK